MSLDKYFKDNLDYLWKKLHKEPKVIKVAVAVSGGADSLALLLMIYKYAQQYNSGIKKVKIFCYTVDHRLRDEAKDEALYVKKLCKNLGIDHKTMTWDWESDGFVNKSKITQEHARNARYKLLCDQCKHDKIEHMITAHHIDDQAETVLMRKNNKSTWFGLSGISAISKINDIYLLRPLLNIRKSELVDYLQNNRIQWCEDPSNKNPKYKRSHIRANLKENKKLTNSLLRLQKDSALKRMNIEESYKQWVSNENNIMLHLKFGFIWINTNNLLELGIDAMAFALKTIISIYTDCPIENIRPISLTKYIRVAQNLIDNKNLKLNVSGCIIQKNNKYIMIYKGKELVDNNNYDGTLKGFDKKQNFTRKNGKKFNVNINSDIVAQMPKTKKELDKIKNIDFTKFLGFISLES